MPRSKQPTVRFILPRRSFPKSQKHQKLLDITEVHAREQPTMSFPFRIRAPATILDPGRNLCYPCKYLMNGLPCRFTLCSFSHDLGLFERWKNGPGRKQCKHGITCPHLQKGVCLYTHPPAKQESDAWVQKRAKEMMINLDPLEDIFPPRHLPLIPVKITNSVYLASFNKFSPTTLSVPGHPPAFHPPTSQLLVTLQPQAPEYPTYTYPFEPLLHSIALTSPTYDLESADLVMTSTNLRKLFSLLTNTRPLVNRFEIEIHGSTMFMSSWTTDPAYNHTAGNYEWAFKAATCLFPEHTPQEKGPVSHHRVEAYQLGGLRCVVQTVVDGYICDDNCRGHRDAELSVHKMEPAGSELEIHHSGGRVPGTCLVHVNARRWSREAWVPPEAQMYFSRRRKLFVGMRHGAVFEPSEGVVDMGECLREWEEENAFALGKLVSLLKTVRQKVWMWKWSHLKCLKTKRFSLVCESDGQEDMGYCRVGLYSRDDAVKLLPDWTGIERWDLESLYETSE